MHCFEWLTMIGWSFFLVEREENGGADKLTLTVGGGPNATDRADQGKVNATSITAMKTDMIVKSRWIRRVIINLFLLVVIPTFVFDTIPFKELTNFVSSFPDDSPLLEGLEFFLLTMDAFGLKLHNGLIIYRMFMRLDCIREYGICLRVRKIITVVSKQSFITKIILGQFTLVLIGVT